MTALASVLGGLAGLGIVIAADGARRRTRDAHTRAWRRAARGRTVRKPWRRLASVVAFGLVAGVVTRWPVAGLLAAAIAWWLPPLYGRARHEAHRASTGRIEAIATWVESLRDTLSAAAGLEQALLAVAPLAPQPIAAPIGVMAARVRAGERLPTALRALGDELADSTADLVIAALITAAGRQGGDLAGLLGELASAAREHAAMRLRLRAEQARIRSAAQIITGATLAMATGLVIWSRDFLHPYDTLTGQLVLAGIGIVFAAAFAWLQRLARPHEPARIFGATAARPAVDPRTTP